MITMQYRHLKKEKIMIERPEVGLDEIPEDHLLVHLCNLQKLERVAEIGVFGGNLTKRVLQNCPTIKEYIAVDPWKVYIESYDREPHARERSQDWWETIYQKVLEIKVLFPDQLLIMRTESIKAAKDLAPFLDTDDKKFDAVYLDGIHDAPNLINDIYCWLPLCKDYGVICGHDYIKRYRNMMIALEKVFGDHFNFWHIDKSRPASAHRNQGQGGNWWVYLTPEIKKEVITTIESEYSMLLLMGNQDKVIADYNIGLD